MSIKNQNDLLCFILLYLIIYLLMIIFFFMCGFDGLTIGFGALILLFLIMLGMANYNDYISCSYNTSCEKKYYFL